MWDNIFGKNKSQDWKQFLEEPEATYKRVTADVQSLNEARIADKAAFDVDREQFHTEVEELQNERDTTVSERDAEIVLLQNTKSTLEAQVSIKESENAYQVDRYNRLATKLKDNLAAEKRVFELNCKHDYEVKLAKKEAQLEKDYSHEVHTLKEEQMENMRELVPEIVKNTIIGFHNEGK